MIDIRLVNSGRRLMNSEKKREQLVFVVILTVDRIVKRMNLYDTYKRRWDQQTHIRNEVCLWTLVNNFYISMEINS